MLSNIGAAEDSWTTCPASASKVSVQWRGGDQNILLGDSHVRLLLLPEEEDVEILHERHEHVGDILQDFRAFFQGIEELPFCVRDHGGYQGPDHAAAD